jgi:hypothetical protein
MGKRPFHGGEISVENGYDAVDTLLRYHELRGKAREGEKEQTPQAV